MPHKHCHKHKHKCKCHSHEHHHSHDSHEYHHCPPPPPIPCPPETLKFYYRLTVSSSDSTNNSSQTDFVTDPADPGTYRGIQNKFMVNSDYETYNQNIITFVGYRTPRNTSLPSNLQVPDLYNETVSINLYPYSTNNYIQASANYVDESGGFETTVPFVDYTVMAASGVFEGYKNFRIRFFNDGNPPGYTGLGPVRIIELTK